MRRLIFMTVLLLLTGATARAAEVVGGSDDAYDLSRIYQTEGKAAANTPKSRTAPEAKPRAKRVAGKVGARKQLKSGFHLRYAPGGHVERTNMRSRTVTVLEERGAWRHICLDGRGSSCGGGHLSWTHESALTEVADAGGPADAVSSGGGETVAPKPVPPPHAVVKKPTAPRLPVAEDASDDPKGFELPSRLFAPSCQTFIGRKGLGSWGKQMRTASKQVAPRCMYERNFYGYLCPNYSRLTLAQKNAMIAMTFAAIAQSESTCNPGSQAQGTNDIADGMFQLEYSASQRSAAGRDEKWCRTRQDVDTQSSIFQSQCAVSIIDDTVCGWGSYIFGSGGYWAKLRNNREITQRIYRTSRIWGLCHD